MDPDAKRESQALHDVLNELKKKKPDVFVLDLDFIAPAQWAKLLQLLNHENHVPQNIILFTPGFHDPKNVEILHKLERGGGFTAFAKPINVMEVSGEGADKDMTLRIGLAVFALKRLTQDLNSKHLRQLRVNKVREQVQIIR